MRFVLICALALAAPACSFDPPALPPPVTEPAMLGAACSANEGCASMICGPRQVCDECRIFTDCGLNRACDTGRCVDVEVTAAHRHVPAIGARSSNGVHTHVGQVGVAAVTSSRELR